MAVKDKPNEHPSPAGFVGSGTAIDNDKVIPGAGRVWAVAVNNAGAAAAAVLLTGIQNGSLTFNVPAGDGNMITMSFPMGLAFADGVTSVVGAGTPVLCICYSRP